MQRTPTNATPTRSPNCRPRIGHLLRATLLGRHGINAHYEALFVAAPRSRHLLTNIIIDIIDVTGAEQAAARCRYSRWSLDTDVTLLAIARHPPPSPQPLVIRFVRSRARP